MVRVIVANQFVLSCTALKWQGQIPMIVVLFKWKGKSVSPQSTCFAQADLHVLKTQSIFFVISGIFKCFLSSVAHLPVFEIKKSCLPLLFKSRAGHRSCCCHFKGETSYKIMLGCYFHEHKCKATYIESGVDLDVMVNCKFAIIFMPY